MSSNSIFDNQSQSKSVGRYLKNALVTASAMRVVSPYFTIYAFKALKQELKKLAEFNFLFGDPKSIAELDPSQNEDKPYFLQKEELIPNHALCQKYEARQCEDWIKKEQVKIRSIKKSNLLHGKLYHLENKEEEFNQALVGSSNFTLSGLGLGSNSNIEINTVAQSETAAELKIWFENLWKDSSKTEDVKQKVIDALNRLGENQSPQFIYYLTLYRLFKDEIDMRLERDENIDRLDLKKSQIWGKLYPFQSDAVSSIILRLLQYNGCILADSVGLGKTFTALAVIKYFESRNDKVLVLCPKRLKENWERFHYSMKGDFEEDKFNYVVKAHTDLDREQKNFNWGGFDLLVIDESHNFRNANANRRSKDGKIIKSRYNKLFEQVIRSGARTKVLMLSATPVNTTLHDLRNQISLMTGKDSSAFIDIGINDFNNVIKVAQHHFSEWERSADRDKTALLDQLGGDFIKLIDAITISRSRKHIKDYYPDFIKKQGDFPEHLKPDTRQPKTDEKGEFSYEEIHKNISKFRLSLYMPSAYANQEIQVKLEEEKKATNFGQQDREKSLIYMMRINFLKRLESSAYSFCKTLERILKRIEDREKEIEDFKQGKNIGNPMSELESNGDLEDDEFYIDEQKRYHLSQLNLDKWLLDLQKDKELLEKGLKRAKLVTPERDAKLNELKRVLREKVKNSRKDKDGSLNKKALIFTTFSDTAKYLYNNLKDFVESDLGLNIGLVVGSGNNESSINKKNYEEILNSFSPRSQLKNSKGLEEEIDFLIATDCISEGQNLQDCDLVINYDIHWNPVRIVQRFGRIDRIGSRNKSVGMVNFWPDMKLDDYLNLKSRVEARMALVNSAATGEDDPFATAKTEAENEIKFRDRQLRRLQDEILDLDAVSDSISMNDLTLDEFFADLRNYLESKKAKLTQAPNGLFSVIQKNDDAGVIFCLRRKNIEGQSKNEIDSSITSNNPLDPHYLVYVKNDGNVHYGYANAKQILRLFGKLCRDKNDPDNQLCDEFDKETDRGQDMEKYDDLLKVSLKSIKSQFKKKSNEQLINSKDGMLPPSGQRPDSFEQFELVSWLVILNKSRHQS